MNEEIDKYLTEAMGECYFTHEIKHLGFSKYTCSCGGSWDSYALEEPEHCTAVSTDFSTWEGFGKLWEWTRNQEWWLDFSRYLDTPTVKCNDILHIDFRVISPEVFASSIYDFLNK